MGLQEVNDYFKDSVLSDYERRIEEQNRIFQATDADLAEARNENIILR